MLKILVPGKPLTWKSQINSQKTWDLHLNLWELLNCIVTRYWCFLYFTLSDSNIFLMFFHFFFYIHRQSLFKPPLLGRMLLWQQWHPVGNLFAIICQFLKSCRRICYHVPCIYFQQRFVAICKCLTSTCFGRTHHGFWYLVVIIWRKYFMCAGLSSRST